MNAAWTSVIDVTGWTLLHFVWQGTLLALGLGFVLSLVPRTWAQTRYLLACLALAGMAVVPVATASYLAAHPAEPGEPLAGMAGAVRIETGITVAATRGGAVSVASPPAMKLAAGRPSLLSSVSRVPPSAWFPWLVAAWLAGVCLCSVRLAGGWWHTRRLLRDDAFEAESGWVDAVGRLSARLGLHRPVQLLESARVQVPVVIGSLKPVLLLPAAAMAGLSPQQVEAVLAHELAHIRRHDYLVNLLQSAAETVLFYHPAVWWVSHTIRVEREHCCDDVAVTACGDALLYAKALTNIEALRHEHIGMAMAVSSGSLLSRVRRLLGVRPPARVAASGWVVISLTALLVAAAGLVGWVGSAMKAIPSFALPAEAAMTLPEGAVAAQQSAAPSPTPQPPADNAAARAPAPTTPASKPDDTWSAEDQASMERAMREMERTVAHAVEQAQRELERSLRSSRDLDTGEAVSPALAEAMREMSASLEKTLARMQRDLQETLGASFQGRMQSEMGAALENAQRELREHRGDLERAARELSREATSMQREAMRQHQGELREFSEQQSRAMREQSRQLAEQARQLAEQARALAAQSLRSMHIDPKDSDRNPALPAPPAPPVPPAPVPQGVPAPPAPPTPPVPPAPPKGAVFMQGGQGGSWNMVRTEDGKTLKLQGKGRVDFTDDDQDIRSLEPGGRFAIEASNGWFSSFTSARFEATAAKDGTLSRTYTIDGKAVSEAEGRKWLATILPELVREFAIGADARVARILAKSGPDGVLGEIAHVKSGWAKHVYFVQLFAQAPLDSATLARSLRQAGQQVDSDFALAAVLKKAAERFTLDDVTAPAYADMSRAIESDFEARQALQAALARAGVTTATAARLVRAALPQGGAGIDSDFEMAELLRRIPAPMAVALGPAYFEAAASIGSDFERRRVLAGMASCPGCLDGQAVAAIATATTTMGSDFERAEILLAVARNQRLDGATRDAVVKAAERISSDFERGRVLSALVKKGGATTGA